MAIKPKKSSQLAWKLIQNWFKVFDFFTYSHIWEFYRLGAIEYHLWRVKTRVFNLSQNAFQKNSTVGFL
jgi:hypothetical protein